MKSKLDLKRAIKDHNFTNADVAGKLGVTVPSLYSYFKGNPSVETIYRIADILGEDPRDLYYAVDDAGNEIAHTDDPYLRQSVPLLKGTPALPFLSTLSNSLTDEHMKSSNDESMKSSNDEKSSSDGDSASLPVGETRKADVLICPHCGTKFMVLE